MILANRQTIEDIIIEVLARFPNTIGPKLVTLVQKRRSSSTKQAVYYALKSLIESEIVSKAGSSYFISRVWINRVQNLLSSQENKSSNNDLLFSSLSDKQSISYSFPNLMACERYWAHVFDIFMSSIPRECPIFVWNPHEWFVIGREKVEREVFKAFETRKKYAFYTIHGNTPLDTEFKDKLNNKFVTICTNSDIRFADNYYLNIFGDFILEVFLNKRLAREIDIFYKSNKKLSIINIAEFKKLINQKFPIRMKISRNEKKAYALRRKLSKEYLLLKSHQI